MWVRASNNVAASPSKFVVGDDRFNRFAQGIYITLPYTLSVFMVRYFQGSSASEEQIGRNTGVLVGSSLSRFVCTHHPQLVDQYLSSPLRAEQAATLQAAAASVGQCLSSFMWGTISDHIGRKVQSKKAFCVSLHCSKSQQPLTCNHDCSLC